MLTVSTLPRSRCFANAFNMRARPSYRSLVPTADSSQTRPPARAIAAYQKRFTLEEINDAIDSSVRGDALRNVIVFD